MADVLQPWDASTCLSCTGVLVTLQRVSKVLQVKTHCRQFSAIWEPRMHVGAIYLHQQVEVARCFVSGDWCVRPHHHLIRSSARTRHTSLFYEHVLTDREPQQLVRVIESKAQNARVVRHSEFFLQQDFLVHLRVQKWVWARGCFDGF